MQKGEMMLSTILRKYYYKLHYPGAVIDTRSIVTGKSVVDPKAIISGGCLIGDSHISSNSKIYDSELQGVNIGSFSYIGYNSKVARVDIGRFCSVASQLLAGLGIHPADYVSTSPVFYSTKRQCGFTFSDCNHIVENEDIVIKNDVWIGARVFLKDGITIGNGAIVAAGAVVVNDVPDYAIVGGTPAKVIKYRFENSDIDRLLSLNWWDWEPELLSSAQELFRSNNIERLYEWAKERSLVKD